MVTSFVDLLNFEDVLNSLESTRAEYTTFQSNIYLFIFYFFLLSFDFVG